MASIRNKFPAFHLTYECDLACVGCNRGCFIKPPFIPSMTIGRFEESLEDILENKVSIPSINLLGGEPTLHPQFMDFVKTAVKYSEKFKCKVIIVSNNYSKDCKNIIKEIKDIYKKKVLCAPSMNKIKNHDFSEEHKNFFQFKRKFIFISPKDAGIVRHQCSYPWQGNVCGFGVDELGYTICTPGVVVDSLLGLNVRATKIAQLLDKDFLKWQSSKLCEHCGVEVDYEIMNKMPRIWTIRGTAISETWHKAIMDKSPKQIQEDPLLKKLLL